MSSVEQEQKDTTYNYLVSIRRPQTLEWGAVAWLWVATIVASSATLIAVILNPTLREYGGGVVLLGSIGVFLVCATLTPLIPSSHGWEVVPSEVENVIEDFKKRTGWEVEPSTKQRVTQKSNTHLNPPPRTALTPHEDEKDTRIVTVVTDDHNTSHLVVAEITPPQTRKYRTGDMAQLSFTVTQSAKPEPPRNHTQADS